jgi:hypothetical protein
MKRALMLFIPLVLILVFPLISAEIIINQQPQDVYSLGDSITVPVTIKTSSDISGTFNMDLLCNGMEQNFYKNGVSLKSGEEKRYEASLILTKEVIGELKGTCKVKAYLGEQFVLTEDFRISNLITITATIEKTEFNPGESILIEGEAVKENGKAVNGYIELSMIEGNITIISQKETINNGFFSINITFSKNSKAGAYVLRLDAHEEDSLGETTNKGFTVQNIRILQVPTNIEIVFETKEVEPGTNLIVKAILRDQTGEKIPSTSFLTIKNSKDKILDQREIATDEFFEFPVAYNQIPTTWKVFATSNKLTAESTFEIIGKESIKIEIINRTVTITNTGNVPYNKTALIRIGNESIGIDVYLDIDKSQKYLLSAPDGEYEVEVVTDQGTESASVALTGNAIDVKKAANALGIVHYPAVWVFVILILGFVAFLVLKKGYQKTFIGYIGRKVSKKKSDNMIPLAKKSLINSSSKAEMSLSIKGDKQNVSVLALHIKNLNDIQSKKGNAEETLQKIVDLAEQNKAVTYENQSTIFFIFAPGRTKTFKNETTALQIAQRTEEILKEHNKMFSQKISFGIALNYGTIVAKQDPQSNTIKFMSLGTLMASSKKIAAHANEGILLGEKIRNNMTESVKTEKHEKGNMNVYSIKEVKDVEGNKKFIRSFLDRIEGKGQEGKRLNSKDNDKKE